MKKKETGVITSREAMKGHKTGEKHYEREERVTVPLEVIEQAKLPNIEIIEAKEVSDEILRLCHDHEYIEFLKKRSSQAGESSENLYEDDHDMKISKGSEKAARASVACVIKACDFVALNELHNAFCLIRPPGHHALRERAMGFCFYNNLAIGAKYLRKKFPEKIKKVLIIDWDLHHGNGTQSFFENDDNTFYFSLQLQGVFPGQSSEEKMENESTVNVNVHSALTGMDEISLAFSRLEAKMEFFRPDLIMISCGFDGHAEEKIVRGGFGLTDDDYVKLTKRVKQLAEKYCDGRLVSVLEGGYNVEVLSRVILAHLQVLADS